MLAHRRIVASLFRFKYMNDKVKIRGKLLKVRESIPENIRAIKNAQIFKNLSGLDLFQKSEHILVYYSHNGEADTKSIIDKYLDEKQIYLPVVRGKSHFQAIPIKRPLNLKPGALGIPEPFDIDPNSVFDDKIELVITPGVAFDKKGNRIGMGKGYYDKYFEHNNSVIKVALAYEEQVLDSIPKDKYDKPVDVIVTDQNVYICKS